MQISIWDFRERVQMNGREGKGRGGSKSKCQSEGILGKEVQDSGVENLEFYLRFLQ